MITRRTLTAMGPLSFSALGGRASPGISGPRLAAPEPMDFDRLKALANEARDRPYTQATCSLSTMFVAATLGETDSGSAEPGSPRFANSNFG